jgi:hypothetical protein
VTKYQLWAVVREQYYLKERHHNGRSFVSSKPCTTSSRHLHGTYDTHQLAEWWAINSKGVWHDGETGPKARFYQATSVAYWEIEAVEV